MDRTRVVRSWARRRLQNAILSELRSRGFDGQGRRLEKIDARTAGPAKNALPNHLQDGESRKIEESDLIGSADIRVLEKIVEVKYETVQEQAGLVVQEILKVCSQSTRKPHGGLPITAKKRNSVSKGQLTTKEKP